VQDLLVRVLTHPSLAERPDLVLAVAGGFALVGALALVARRRGARILSRPWPGFAAAVLWALYALWEAEMRGKGFDMRVDLLLIHPFLTIASVLALASAAWPAWRPESAKAEA
jgi:hypothetical protein